MAVVASIRSEHDIFHPVRILVEAGEEPMKLHLYPRNFNSRRQLGEEVPLVRVPAAMDGFTCMCMLAGSTLRSQWIIKRRIQFGRGCAGGVLTGLEGQWGLI